jgi:glycerate 2-kinase
VMGVCRRASAHGVPTYAVVGLSGLNPAEARAAGFAGVYPLSDLEPDPGRSIAGAAELLAVTTERLARELSA